MSIIIMILLLSFLVLVHEAGHFLAARMLGIKVSKFGFGLPIGPTLFSKKVGDVEVLVHAFLLGGYVAFPDDEKDSDIPADSPERFQNKPVWKRMVVISAGVIANIITAFFLVMIVAISWGKLPSENYEIYVKEISAPKESSVHRSGLMPNDRIVRINGSDVITSHSLSIYAKNSKVNDGKISQEVLNSTLEKVKALNPNIPADELLKENTTIVLPDKVDEPELKFDAETLKGYKLYHDNQLSLNDRQVKLRDELKDESLYVTDGTTTLTDIAYAISDTKHPIHIVVLREGKEIPLRTVYSGADGLLGVMIETKDVLIPTKGFAPAITGTCKYIWTQTYMLCYGLCQLFTGKIPMKDLHGIVVITKIGGDVIHNNGIFSGLLLTAMISLDLALVNFLPIPALDGGHFMFLIIEKIMGKPLDEDAVNKVSTVFFILLILFMLFVVFNDIYALVKHKL